MSAKKTVEAILKELDVRIGGDRPHDIVVHDERVYSRVLSDGTLGLGEAYMDGWWDARKLDSFIAQVIRSHAAHRISMAGVFGHALVAKFLNLQNKARAFMVGEHHYDIGNDVYKAMLGDIKAYTCAYYNGKEKTLEQAQFDKHDLICKKLGLKGGERILDIGCGNGEFMYHAAKYYNAKEVVGVTVSKEQTKLAQERLKEFSADFIFSDYRDVTPEDYGMFDHVVSIGMAEQVGNKNFKKYLQMARRMLKPDGLFLLHTIISNTTQHYGDPWLHTYIFPNGALPSVSEITRKGEGLFVLEDVHNFGTDYDTTLLEWWRRFDAAWPTLREQYDERFYRMWKYYLLSCAGLFRARHVQLIQFVFSPNGVRNGYSSVR